ncbi:MAG TPA: hypothetical protein VMR66_11955 [Gemmatimonadota bacterium]|nr:hypothetical protein [Gemmatimonadota bacterium]
MDWLYAHLAVNHFPIVLAVVASAATVVAAASGREGAWRYAGVTGLLAGLTAPIAYITGTRAEDAAEELWYTSHEVIERHEHWGLYALIALGVAGLLAIVALRTRSSGPRWAFALAIWIATGVATVTALFGGDIVHESEALRDGGPAAGSGGHEE